MQLSADISGFVKKGKASVLFDGQFGSTGKGLAAAWIGEHNEIDWAVTNASANAGHTTIMNGVPVVTFHIPSSFLTARDHSPVKIYIDAGAIIDIEVLKREIEELGIRHHEILVHPNAAVITAEDREAEMDPKSAQTKIASTRKGVGQALSNKVLRRGKTLGQMHREGLKVPFQVTPVSLNMEMKRGCSVLVEVPQGFSLSLNASQFYPYTTSRDCTPQQGLSDAGIHPRFFHKSMVVLRTYPIRVGNIKEEGKQLGFSGYVYPDQYETSWEALSQTPEITTVTKRIRRVFNFSKAEYQKMMEHCFPDVVFLNFANYCNRSKMESILSDMKEIEHQIGASVIKYYGYGPSSAHISEYVL